MDTLADIDHGIMYQSGIHCRWRLCTLLYFLTHFVWKSVRTDKKCTL